MPPMSDQQRVKDLLTETITLLCKSGLSFESQFTIEGLIGITIDQSEVLLISLKETICLQPTGVVEIDKCAKENSEQQTTVAEDTINCSGSSLAKCLQRTTTTCGSVMTAAASSSGAKHYVDSRSVSRPIMHALLLGSFDTSGLSVRKAPPSSLTLANATSEYANKAASSSPWPMADEVSRFDATTNVSKLPSVTTSAPADSDRIDTERLEHDAIIIKEEDESLLGYDENHGLDDSLIPESESFEYPLNNFRQRNHHKNHGNAASSVALYSHLQGQNSSAEIENRRSLFLSDVELGCTLDANPIHYTLDPAGSNRGGAVLVGSDGYRYCIKMVKPNVTYWRCAVRNRIVNCRSVVIQRGSTFVRGTQEHCHPPTNSSTSSDDVSQEQTSQAMDTFSDLHPEIKDLWPAT